MLINIHIVGEEKGLTFSFCDNLSGQTTSRPYYLKTEVGISNIEIASFLFKP